MAGGAPTTYLLSIAPSGGPTTTLRSEHMDLNGSLGGTGITQGTRGGQSAGAGGFAGGLLPSPGVAGASTPVPAWQRRHGWVGSPPVTPQRETITEDRVRTAESLAESRLLRIHRLEALVERLRRQLGTGQSQEARLKDLRIHQLQTQVASLRAMQGEGMRDIDAINATYDALSAQQWEHELHRQSVAHADELLRLKTAHEETIRRMKEEHAAHVDRIRQAKYPHNQSPTKAASLLPAGMRDGLDAATGDSVSAVREARRREISRMEPFQVAERLLDEMARVDTLQKQLEARDADLVDAEERMYIMEEHIRVQDDEIRRTVMRHGEDGVSGIMGGPGNGSRDVSLGTAHAQAAAPAAASTGPRGGASPAPSQGPDHSSGLLSVSWLDDDHSGVGGEDNSLMRHHLEELRHLFADNRSFTDKEFAAIEAQFMSQVQQVGTLTQEVRALRAKLAKREATPPAS